MSHFRAAACAVLAFALSLTTLGATAEARGVRKPDATKLAYFQQSNIFQSGLRGTHTLALTFDDGPSASTPSLLRVLKKNQVPATFFIVGTMAKRRPGVLKQIAADGHLLANHSATHA